MPIIAHPLVSDQVNGMLLKTLLDDTLKSFNVSVFEIDPVAGISTIQRVVDLAGNVERRARGMAESQIREK